MDLKRLRGFVAVADAGSVSAAAVRLRLTQPALSRQLRDLQQDLGLRLFEPVGRGLRLSGEGEEFLPQARDLLGHADAVAERARALALGDTGVLRVGATGQLIESVFPAFLRRYQRDFPGVHVMPVEAGATEHTRLLDRGEIHVAIGIRPTDTVRFATLALPPGNVLVAHAPSLAIAREGAGHVDVRMLDTLPLLLLDRSFGTRRLFDAACRLARLDPVIRFEGSAVHALLALAEAEFGAAVIPATVRTAGRQLRIARLTYRDEPIAFDFAVVWDRLRPLPRYAEGFPAAVAAHVREVWPIARPTGGTWSPGRSATPAR
ncbi:LysR family transcriptional regulator [Elioraea sp.]|uniref:LysR family transcriptional regulator n=1 Tax=Elioraea sp. TaxID=2185103 RepID=UPI003F701D8B